MSSRTHLKGISNPLLLILSNEVQRKWRCLEDRLGLRSDELFYDRGFYLRKKNGDHRKFFARLAIHEHGNSGQSGN